MPDTAAMTIGAAASASARLRQQRVEALQFSLAPGEGPHRGRELGRHRRRRRNPRIRCRPSRRVEVRVLPENGRLQAPQLLAGVHAQLLVERAPQLMVDGQRVRRPAAAVQRQHELPPELLVQRPTGHQLLKVRDQRRVLPGRQPGLDPGALDSRLQQV